MQRRVPLYPELGHPEAPTPQSQLNVTPRLEPGLRARSLPWGERVQGIVGPPGRQKRMP